ncbi:glutamine--fructose-6-phosphate transaminase (isomerizing) [Candidatus Hakubella thermalkaliphila]|uniref:Glutamine--fructose-6-phosphate aminotransferase [isomerizing] n=1 Tax=Candidatus Hakubella thermalkaliphila TaxID=2754717 RepID=A0A6V8Q374_9ACTN|nr:glutamine--fructose-6-phosphate transaminase (isomerizing) [Candidatus Hakubella thermalkaliphila]GFP39222.1 glutamine---fructose-6-phosphate transaminase (isomerizing) [Candidatus Hakubella thermalkaliphila]
MCGIVAYVGERECQEILFNGLKRLEYRGYDSAGLAVLNGQQGEQGIVVIKEKGSLEALGKALDGKCLSGRLGIGHTRWATHGVPSAQNAHPHLDCSARFAVVHNGIIENFSSLKRELIQRGHRFVSETDTEVLPHLVEEYYQGDLLEAMGKAVSRIRGSGAVVFLCQEEPHRLVAFRMASPLVVGLGTHGNFLASDIPALLGHTREFILVNDGEIVEVTRDGARIFDLQGRKIERDSIQVDWDISSAEKAGFEDFMLKEIFEQPVALAETLRGRVADHQVDLREMGLSDNYLCRVNRIHIVAMGTSYHAGMVAKQVLEKWVRIPTELFNSSEYRYQDPILDGQTLVIAITQSGETTDTLAAVREARGKGAQVLGITNVVGSSITREVDGLLFTRAGPEIGVAASKTFTAQILVAYLLALYMAEKRNALSAEVRTDLMKEMEKISEMAAQVLEDTDEIKKCADLYQWCPDFLFLGRTFGLPVALEGALKLKEISYVHAEGYAAGEMKHGPIALIEPSCPVVAVSLQGGVYEKMISNIMEVKARNATVIAVAHWGDEEISRYVDHVFFIPQVREELSVIPVVIPLQLFAYFVAKNRGCNVDQPRNLAKSVTVE